MAERIVSPGVFTRENDQSFLAQGIGEIGAAFVGPFKQGPAFVPTLVRTQSEFEAIFGTPDGTYYTDMAVQRYLREAGTVTVVRIMGIGGYSQKTPIGLLASGSAGEQLIATIHSTETGNAGVGFGNFTVTPSTTISGSFVVSGSGISPTSASLLSTNINSIDAVFGRDPLGTKDGYTYTYFKKSANEFTYTVGANSNVVGYTLPEQDYEYDATSAHTPWVVSQEISEERYQLFRFHTINQGTLENTRFKIGISNVKPAGTASGTDYASFTVSVRAFSDTDRRKSVIETFNNVNLDPNSPNYIARAIGDVYRTSDTNGKITEFGNWANKSRNIRVEVAPAGTYPIVATPYGHTPYTNPITVDTNEASIVPAVIYQTGSVDNTSTSLLRFSGIDLDTPTNAADNINYLNPIPDGAEIGANEVFAFDSVTGGNISSPTFQGDKHQFILAFQYGFDGMSPAVSINLGSDITSINSQGFDLSNPNASGYKAYQRAISALSNADEYDINMIITPGVIRELHPGVTTMVIDMAESRQDCFYIADFAKVDSTITTVVEQSNAVDSNYVGTYYPWVKTVDVNTNQLITVPPSVLMPAVYAANDSIAAEWFAPAGLNRGGIVGAVSVVDRLTHSERDILYENKVNPIASFPGQGIVAFGQKTLQSKPSALDRINVRRLLIRVKKFVASTSRFLVFEQNTATTRNRFINTVQPYLEGIQQRQGLFAFRVIMDETNNTPDVIDRNILNGQIFLQPTRTAEFLVIDFNILPTTGAIFSD